MKKIVLPTIILVLTILVLSVLVTSSTFEARIFGKIQEVEGETNILVNFHTEVFDTFEAFDADIDKTRLTFNRDATCLIQARVRMTHLESGDWVNLTIQFTDFDDALFTDLKGNSFPIAGDNAFMSTEGSPLLNASTIFQVSEGDYVEVLVYHTADETKKINSNVLEVLCQ